MQLCMSSALPLAIIICYASSVIQRWTVFICCKHVWKSLILHGLISEAEILFFSLTHTHKHIYMYHKVKIHGDISVLRKKKAKGFFFFGGGEGCQEYKIFLGEMMWNDCVHSVWKIFTTSSNIINLCKVIFSQNSLNFLLIKENFKTAAVVTVSELKYFEYGSVHWNADFKNIACLPHIPNFGRF